MPTSLSFYKLMASALIAEIREAFVRQQSQITTQRDLILTTTPTDLDAIVELTLEIDAIGVEVSVIDTALEERRKRAMY